MTGEEFLQLQKEQEKETNFPHSAHSTLSPNEHNHRYAYGIPGIAEIFGCSIPTAHRIKKSGKINKAITQIGRKIIVDVELALELAGHKTGGRK